ncbi:hypothetical protein COOONC_03689 [Cooperia oncophora]
MGENPTVPWGNPKGLLKRTGGAFALANTRYYDSHPTDPENDTDIDLCIQRLLDNDPTLKEINMNNMKRTPIPQLRRLLEALAYNEHCERLSLANMGLYDNDLAVLMPVLEINRGLKKLNIETNYLSGDFFIKFFQAALTK